LTVVLVTYFHVVIGEVVPKSLALANPDRAIKTLLPWMRLLQTVGYPIVVLLNGAGNWLMRALGVSISEVHGKLYTGRGVCRSSSRRAPKAGFSMRSMRTCLGNLLDLPHRTIRQIMKPRTQIVGIPLDLPSDKVMGFIDQNRHTPLPHLRPRSGSHRRGPSTSRTSFVGISRILPG
jgi:CBS domain containing-hemolysin-like protein